MTVLQKTTRTGVGGRAVGQFIGTALLMAAIGVGAFFAAEAITDSSQEAGPAFGSEGRLEADRVLGSAAGIAGVVGWSVPDVEADGVAGATLIDQLANAHQAPGYSEIQTARANAMADYFSAQAWVLPDSEAQGVSGETLIDQLAKAHASSQSQRSGGPLVK